ncbi:MAG: hypothetical protein DRP29_04705, partial [Thermodesulfobacteriota bacterium]
MNQSTGHKGLRSFNRLVSKILYPKTDLCIAVSYGVKESLLKLGVKNEKIKVIYNPYPIEEIEKKAKEEPEKCSKT